MAISTTPTKRVGLAVIGIHVVLKENLSMCRISCQIRRSGPTLDPGNEFPVDPQEEQAKKYRKDKFCNHISTL